MRTETTDDGRLVLADDYEGLRATAQDWHGGQWSAFYALASTGTITRGLAAEAAACLKCEGSHLESLNDSENLRAIAELEGFLTETDD